jgi:hypothetical protein
MDRTPIDTKPSDVRVIAGDAQVEQAIATLVMAFGSDPVARWIYGDPHQYSDAYPAILPSAGIRFF